MGSEAKNNVWAMASSNLLLCYSLSKESEEYNLAMNFNGAQNKKTVCQWPVAIYCCAILEVSPLFKPKP
jgi:hypothetical protein